MPKIPKEAFMLLMWLMEQGYDAIQKGNLTKEQVKAKAADIWTEFNVTSDEIDEELAKLKA